MAILTQNSPLLGAEGILGTLLFRTVGNKTIVSAKPSFPRRRKQSPLQELNRGRFREAAAYAQGAMRDSAKKEYYQKKAREMKLPNAYTAAITDFMRNTRVQSIDIGRYTGKAGGSIAIDAHRKSFTVSQVNVSIATKSGQEVETGMAVRNDSGKWIYKCTVNTVDPKELIIVAGAMDHLGKTMHAHYSNGGKLYCIRGWGADITTPRWMLGLEKMPGLCRS